jgi:hypothetical protein
LSLPDSGSDPRIDDYLDHLYAPLVGRVPYDVRQQIRSELRTHLEALVAAGQEIGASPDQAIREALAQFGDPRRVAREWIRSWRRSAPPGGAESARPATLVALGTFGVATSLALALFATLMASAPVAPWAGLWVPFLVCVVPLLAGLTTGILSPARHALGTFYALALLTTVTTLGTSWLAALAADTPLSELIAVGMMQGLFWIPIGCASAAFGGWLRQKHDETTPRGWGIPT